MLASLALLVARPQCAWEELLGVEATPTGDLDGTALADASELGPLLAEDPRVGACVVKQLYRHAHGRLEDAGEAGALDDITAAFADEGYRFAELLPIFVTHDSFRYLAPGDDQ